MSQANLRPPLPPRDVYAPVAAPTVDAAVKLGFVVVISAHATVAQTLPGPASPLAAEAKNPAQPRPSIFRSLRVVRAKSAHLRRERKKLSPMASSFSAIAIRFL